MVKPELVLVEAQPQPAPCFFSIIIPTYKTTRYIRDALDSVFAQTFNNYEVIVVNDGAPDTVELERQLHPYFERIIYIKQENKGPGGARNSGIRRARGEFIALLDSDDKWLPEHLAEMAQVLRKDPTLDLVYADAMNFGDPNQTGHTIMETNPSNGIADFESLVECRCNVIASCVVARRNVLIEAGLFDENFIYGEDYDLWLRVAHLGKRIEYLKRVHSMRRIHDENLTADTIRPYEGQAEVLKKLMGKLTVAEDVKHKMRLEIEQCQAFIALERGKQNIVARQYSQALEDLWQANTFFKRRKLQMVRLLLRTAPSFVRYFYVKHWTKSLVAFLLGEAIFI
jgi:glycosyltransferase involved in cell wall biosynthesis